MTTLTATPATLPAVLKSALPGETIKLSGSGWGAQSFVGVVKAAPGVVLEGDGSTKIDFLRISECDGLTVRGVVLSSQGQQIALVAKSKRIVLEDFEVAAGNTTTDGVWLRWNEDVTLRRFKAHHLRSAVFHQETAGLTIEDFDIREVYSDGIRGGANSSDIVIRRFSITDQHQVGGDHLDGIQFWTSGATRATKGVAVEDGVITRGNGSPQQGVLIGNEAGLPYEDVRVRNVAVVGGLYNGISVSGAINPVVEDCFVQPMAGATDANGKALDKSWILFRSSTGGEVRDAFATMVSKYQNVSDPTVTGFTPVPLAAEGDYSALTAWQARNAPPAAPADPRDTEIADLKAKLALEAADDAALEATAAQALAEVEGLKSDLKAVRATLEIVAADRDDDRAALAAIQSAASAALASYPPAA